MNRDKLCNGYLVYPLLCSRYETNMLKLFCQLFSCLYYLRFVGILI